MSKTTVILTHLTREDFLSKGVSSEYASTKNDAENLSLVDQLKLEILNVDVPQKNYYVSRISHWSNLPFLHRVIIILESEDVATHLYNYLAEKFLSTHTHVRLSLQENLLRMSKSSDSLHLSDDLTKFKQDHHYVAGDVPAATSKTTLDVYSDLAKLGVDISSLAQPKSLPPLVAPPAITRTKSVTRTLFKPDLHINTSSSTNHSNIPQSPTITLDESP